MEFRCEFYTGLQGAQFSICIQEAAKPALDLEDVERVCKHLDATLDLAPAGVFGEGLGDWREAVVGVGVGVCGLDEELGVVDSAEVACAGGLVLLGVDAEAVDVDVLGGDAGVVCGGLYEAEVLGVAGVGEALVAVELEGCTGDEVSVAIQVAGARGVGGEVEPVVV